MAVGFPAKVNFATGDVLTAAQMNDVTGTLNLLNPAAKGTIFSASAANTPAAVAIGTNGQVLTADSTISSGVKWATPGGSASLTSQSADLAANVTMTLANTYYDGVSISLAAGTWLIIASIYVDDPSNTGGTVTAKLWDGTTVSSSSEMYVGGSTSQVSMTLSGIVAPTGTTTYKISAATSQNIHVIKAAAVQNGAGNNANHISAVKIA